MVHSGSINLVVKLEDGKVGDGDHASGRKEMVCTVTSSWPTRRRSMAVVSVEGGVLRSDGLVGSDNFALMTSLA